MQRAVLSLWLFHLRAASVFLQRWVLSLPAFWGETPACCGRSWNKKGNWYPAAITALTSWSRLLGCTSKPSLEPFCTFPFLFSSSPFLSWWTLTSRLQMHKRAWSWGYRLQLQVTPRWGKEPPPVLQGNHRAAETNVSGLSLPKKLVTHPWGEFWFPKLVWSKPSCGLSFLWSDTTWNRCLVYTKGWSWKPCEFASPQQP